MSAGRLSLASPLLATSARKSCFSPGMQVSQETSKAASGPTADFCFQNAATKAEPCSPISFLGGARLSSLEGLFERVSSHNSPAKECCVGIRDTSQHTSMHAGKMNSEVTRHAFLKARQTVLFASLVVDRASAAASKCARTHSGRLRYTDTLRHPHRYGCFPSSGWSQWSFPWFRARLFPRKACVTKDCKPRIG